LAVALLSVHTSEKNPPQSQECKHTSLIFLGFKKVGLLGYEDSLAVTEAKPLVDYLLSTMHAQELAKHLSAEEFRRRLSTLKDWLAKELAARGSIHITKDTGKFIASC
jgi:hypothetical protein